MLHAPILSADSGWIPTQEDFRLETMTLPELEEGQVLVANTVMSVDPCMRGHMNDVASDMAPIEVGAPSTAAGSAP
ncbi:hypothetical protein [Micrococcus luteus]|uniref:hypothetical protein n=1 Tax=Micrococcus luteus TaxID=1270 RepID=UPI001F50F73A|nr:hypothetical protein [Micrococcus luteus]MCV7528226.1 hypothetical protein [Micrococcus luteus]